MTRGIRLDHWKQFLSAADDFPIRAVICPLPLSLRRPLASTDGAMTASRKGNLGSNRVCRLLITQVYSVTIVREHRSHLLTDWKITVADCLAAPNRLLGFPTCTAPIPLQTASRTGIFSQKSDWPIASAEMASRSVFVSTQSERESSS